MDLHELDRRLSRILDLRHFDATFSNELHHAICRVRCVVTQKSFEKSNKSLIDMIAKASDEIRVWMGRFKVMGVGVSRDLCGCEFTIQVDAEEAAYSVPLSPF